MHVATTRSRQHHYAPVRHSTAAPARIEPLEGRVLMSAAWTTVEDFTPGGAYPIASDPAGNVYVGGEQLVQVDGAPVVLNVIRMKAGGSNEWTTVYSGAKGDLYMTEMAVNAAGDIYLVGQHGAVLELKRSSGATTFTVVDQPAPLVSSKGTILAYPTVSGLATDGAGNVYAAGETSVMGPRNTIVRNWTVRKQTGGQGPFATVDSYAYPSTQTESMVSAISVIPSGPAAGVYVVGHGNGNGPSGHWLVRRSTDGGNTWSTADDFQYDPADNAGAWAKGVAGDALGNVYVVGRATSREQTGGTKRNPTYTDTSYLMTRRGAVGAGGSLSWAVSDALAVANDSWSDVAVDTAGNVFVVGHAYLPDAAGVLSNHSIVRSTVGGRWETVDDAVWNATGIAADNSGNVFTAGRAQEATGSHWIVRTNSGAATSTAAPAPTSPAADPTPTFSTVSISAETDPRDPALDLTSGTADLLA